MTGRSLPDVKSAVESGAVAVICVSLSTANCAGSLSKATPVAPLKPVPVMVTAVPPARGTFAGDTAVGLGARPQACPGRQGSRRLP